MHIFCDNENLHLLLESTLCLSITFDCICKSIFFLILPYYYFIQIKVLPLLSITLSPCNIWTAYSICSTKGTRLMSNIWTKSTEIESICFISSSYLGSWKCSLCIIHSAEAVRSWNCQSRFAGTKSYVWNLFQIQEKWFIQRSRIFSSLKCQVSSFHPARCLLSFAEWTVCSGMCFQGLLSFLFSKTKRKIKHCVGPNWI